MKKDELTKVQSDMILRIERCIKRFEKLEKKIQQPWRNSDVNAKEKPHDMIKKLNDLIVKVSSGKCVNEQAKIALMIMNTIAMSIDCELKSQNMQKALGEEITPFGKMEI